MVFLITGVSYERRSEREDSIYHCELDGAGKENGSEWFAHPELCLPGLHKRGYLKEAPGKDGAFLEPRHPATIDINGFGFHGMPIRKYWGWNSENLHIAS